MSDLSGRNQFFPQSFIGTMAVLGDGRMTSLWLTYAVLMEDIKVRQAQAPMMPWVLYLLIGNSKAFQLTDKS